MRFFRNFIPFVLSLIVAYGGGYYFGRHPNSLHELGSSKSIVIATTEEGLFTRDVQNWLEDRWGHSLIVLLISETEIENRLNDADLIVAPQSLLKPFQSNLRPHPDNLPADWVEPDFLRNNEVTFPLLWRLIKLDDKRFRLIRYNIAWTPRSSENLDLIRWLLSPKGQTLLTKGKVYLPVRKGIELDDKTMKSLRSIPLTQLTWD